MLAFVLLAWHFLRSMWTTVRDPHVRPLAISLFVLLVGGTSFYRTVEGWSWLDSFYFSVITLATVGFGDLAPSTPLSKVFTILYVMVGIGVLVAVANSIVERSAVRTHRRLRAASDFATKARGNGSAESEGGHEVG